MRINYLVRASKAGRNGLAPLELSLIINGERKIMTLDRRIDPKMWDAKRQKVRKDSATNEYITTATANLYAIETKMLQHGMTITMKSFLDIYKNGFGEKTVYIVDYFKGWLKEYSTENVSLVQYAKYQKLIEYFEKYIISKFGEDINIKDFNPIHVEGFFNYLINNGNKNNTAVGKMKKLKHLLQVAVDERVIDKTPFKMRLKVEKLTYTPLTMAEVELIANKDFGIDRLNKVRDIAVVASLTGLAYADLKDLTKEHIHDGVIIKNRHKTDVQSTIPVLPKVQEILERYDYKLPMLTNQKMNAYLKEIGDLCGIKKELHMHLLRHSFATILLNKGVDMTTVSKCCGHSNTKITESIYAEMYTSTIVDKVKSALNI